MVAAFRHLSLANQPFIPLELKVLIQRRKRTGVTVNMDNLKFHEPPKMELVIDNGIFDPIVKILVKLGICHQKERIQSENPQANVRYSFE